MYIAGKRSLKANATPLPITPTQFTVLTSVCASDENMSPVFVVTIFLTHFYRKNRCGVNHDIQPRKRTFGFSFRLFTRHVYALYVGRRNRVEIGRASCR